MGSVQNPVGGTLCGAPHYPHRTSGPNSTVPRGSLPYPAASSTSRGRDAQRRWPARMLLGSPADEPVVIEESPAAGTPRVVRQADAGPLQGKVHLALRRWRRPLRLEDTGSSLG